MTDPISQILKHAEPAVAAAPLRRTSGKIFIRDAVLAGMIGPTIEFFFGFLFKTFTGAYFAVYQILPVYGHTSLLSPLVWGLSGAVLLHFYRRFLV